MFNSGSRSSSRSISSTTSSLSISGGGMQMVGGRQGRISFGGPPQGRAPSVYGGAGGSGTRVSQAYSMMSGYGSGSGSMAMYNDAAVISNEKGTMQSLNDRLASYLDKVRSLEAANKTLELQIRDYTEKRTFISRDLTGYFATIAELQAKIARKHSENHSVLLQIDNAQLASEDFKMKYEMEMNMRSMVEADLTRLRGVRDNLSLTITDVEMQIEGMREELAYMKSNHQEELHLLRAQQSGSVNVEVDSTESVDLTRVLQELRVQYEALAVKNKQDMEKWYQLKMDGLQVQITTVTTEVKTYHSQLSELKRTYQSLEINRESVVTEIQCLQQNLKEVNSRYGVQLSQLQVNINTMEAELQQLRASLEHQRSEYNLLLDLKMRLELEIAEYRRLLEGEHYERKAVVISKMVEVEVEEHKPHIERRVKTIVEEIIDGKVVSTMVDTQLEDIQ